MKIPLTPAVGMFFEQLQADQELIDSMMEQMRCVQKLVKKWSDNPVSVAQCVSDLEALVIVKEA